MAKTSGGNQGGSRRSNFGEIARREQRRAFAESTGARARAKAGAISDTSTRFGRNRVVGVSDPGWARYLKLNHKGRVIASSGRPLKVRRSGTPARRRVINNSRNRKILAGQGVLFDL